MVFILILVLAAGLMWQAWRVHSLRTHLADMQDALELIRLEARSARRLGSSDGLNGQASPEIFPKIQAVESLIKPHQPAAMSVPDFKGVVVSLKASDSAAPDGTRSDPANAAKPAVVTLDRSATSQRPARARATAPSGAMQLAWVGLFALLYASVFFADRLAGLVSPLGMLAAFAFLSIVTLFVASWARARILALLGIAGGFLAVPMVAAGSDRHALLFAFLVLLDVSAVAVALQRRWHLLVPLAVIGTVLAQTAWLVAWYSASQMLPTIFASLAFDVLFLGVFILFRRKRCDDQGVVLSAAGLPFVTLALGWFLTTNTLARVSPVAIFSLVTGATLCLAGVVLFRTDLKKLQLLAGGASMVLLAFWAALHLVPGDVGFAVLGTTALVAAHTGVVFLFRWNVAGSSSAEHPAPIPAGRRVASPPALEAPQRTAIR